MLLQAVVVEPRIPRLQPWGVVKILGGDIVKNEATNMTLRLPNDLKEKLKEKAEAQQRSLHNLIIIALTEYANKR